jgi:prophage regulatory protein
VAVVTVCLRGCLWPHEDVMHDVKAEPKRKLYRLPELLDVTGMGRSWTYREIQAGRFPAPFKLGAASCWDSRAVDRWIDAQVAAQPK